eukprot:Rmarinus@m.24205
MTQHSSEWAVSSIERNGSDGDEFFSMCAQDLRKLVSCKVIAVVLLLLSCLGTAIYAVSRSDVRDQVLEIKEVHPWGILIICGLFLFTETPFGYGTAFLKASCGFIYGFGFGLLLCCTASLATSIFVIWITRKLFRSRLQTRLQGSDVMLLRFIAAFDSYILGTPTHIRLHQLKLRDSPAMPSRPMPSERKSKESLSTVLLNDTASSSSSAPVASSAFELTPQHPNARPSASGRASAPLFEESVCRAAGQHSANAAGGKEKGGTNTPNSPHTLAGGPASEGELAHGKLEVIRENMKPVMFGVMLRLTPLTAGMQNALVALSSASWFIIWVSTPIGNFPADAVLVYLGSLIRDASELSESVKDNAAPKVLLGIQFVVLIFVLFGMSYYGRKWFQNLQEEVMSISAHESPLLSSTSAFESPSMPTQQGMPPLHVSESRGVVV